MFTFVEVDRLEGPALPFPLGGFLADDLSIGVSHE